MRHLTIPLPGTRALRLAALVPLLAIAACGPFRRGGDVAKEPTIIFRNESVEQATVYAVSRSQESVRIGTVNALQTDTLTVPMSLTLGGGTRIFVRLLARTETPATGEVSLYADQAIEVTLPSNLRMLEVLPAKSP